MSFRARVLPNFQPRNTVRAKELRNAATPAERILWRYLARGQLGAKFSRQMPVGPYFADFLCRDLRLIIELDGFSHEIRPDHDLTRDERMRDLGYQVVRFTNEQVFKELEFVLAAIAREIGELQGGPPRCD